MTYRGFSPRLRFMKNGLGILLISTFLTFSALAGNQVIPENDLSNPAPQLPLRVKNNPDVVSEQDFQKVVQILQKLYSSVVRDRAGAELVIKSDWQEATVNAYATREEGQWVVHVPGGIARAKGMTKDSLAFIVCHELGHHLGGAPRTFLFDGWPSAEGQADYWASSKCLKSYYEELAAEEISVGLNIPEKIIHDCSVVYRTFKEQKVCIRTMLASIAFANFLNQLPGSKGNISIDTPDTRVVKGTNTNDYPRAQCRLDTLYQGALCTVGSQVATSETDPKIGNCIDESKPGTRPKCWFKP